MIRLNTYKDIEAAAVRIQDYQRQLADGTPLDLDDQRAVLTIAYAALLIAGNARQAVEAAAVWCEDDDDRAPPAWLRALQDDDVPLMRPPIPGRRGES
jgi:hypothetical protein